MIEKPPFFFDEVGYTEISFQGADDSSAVSGVRVLSSDLLELNLDLERENEHAPEAVDSRDFIKLGVDSIVRRTVKGIEGRPLVFNVSGLVSDANADLLEYSVVVNEVKAVSDRGDAEGDDLINATYLISKVGYDRFEIDAQTPGEYAFTLTATDATGLSVQTPFYISIVPDTDRDGFLDDIDFDDDNDGVNDYPDTFPKDPSESADADADGIGDNADTDDDNDGVDDSSDAYPFSSNCSRTEEGNGETCYVETIHQRKILFDGNGVLYFYKPGQPDIARYNVDSGSFIEPLMIGQTEAPAEKMAIAIINPAHNRLYIGYETGALTYIDLTRPEFELGFVEISQPVRMLLPAGDFLLAFDKEPSQAKANISVFDINANLTAEAQGRLPVFSGSDYRNSNPISDYGNYVVDDIRGVFHDDFEVGDLDLLTGELIAEQDKISSPLIVQSPDGELSLHAFGEIYESQSDVEISKLSNEHQYWNRAQIAWVDDGISYLQWGNYNRINTSGEILEQYPLAGAASMALYSYGSDLIAVSYDSSVEKRFTYIERITPSDDTDGDGYSNLNDDYPNDPAIAVDSDRDGYPDFWNPGYTASSVNSELNLDAYPGVVDCYLLQHGDGVGCDPSLTIEAPFYRPDDIFLGRDNIVYIHRGQYVTRYSLVENRFKPSIFVGTNDPYRKDQMIPNLMAYSEIHHRLYLSYDSKITKIDLDESLEEQAFLITDLNAKEILATDEYLIATTGMSNPARVYYDHEANYLKQSINPFQTSSITWDPALNRIYVLNNYAVHFESLNPDEFTGAVTYLDRLTGDGSLLRVSSDGQQFLQVNGMIHNVEDLSLVTSLNEPRQYFRDIIWLSNGNIAGVGRPGGDQNVLQVYDSEYQLIEKTILDKQLSYAVFEYQEKLYVFCGEQFGQMEVLVFPIK